jgi:hypothetical protein
VDRQNVLRGVLQDAFVWAGEYTEERPVPAYKQSPELVRPDFLQRAAQATVDFYRPR